MARNASILLVAQLSLGTMFAGRAAAQAVIDGVAVPESAVADAFGRLLDVLRDEDAAAIERSVAELWSGAAVDEIGRQRIVGSMRMWRARHPDATLVEVREASERRLVGVMQDRVTEQYFAYAVDRDDADPTRIANARILPALPPLSVARRELTPDQGRREVATLVERLAALDRFSGVVCLARGDEPVVRIAAGRASRRYAEAVTEETLFNVGSITKLCTAVAVMRFVERGELRLSDPIGGILADDWITEQAGGAVTVEHLFRHTGGVGDFLEHPDYASAPRGDLRDLEGLVRYCRVDQLEGDPGRAFVYSNTGFVLLGKIVSVLARSSYDDAMQREVYGPAAMRSTGCFDWDRPPGPMAEGFYRARDPRAPEGAWVSNVFLLRARGCPAGGSYSTARDLLALGRALATGRLLTAESVTAMRTPAPDAGSPGYGLGCQLFERDRWISGYGHSGGAPGVRAHLVVFPGHDLTLVVLSNYGDAYDAVFEKCMLVATGLVGGWRGD